MKEYALVGRRTTQLADALDYVIVAYILMQVFALEFFLTGRLLKYIGVALIALRLLITTWRNPKAGSIPLAFTVIWLALLSTLAGPLDIGAIGSAFVQLLSAASYVGYTYLLHKMRPGFLEGFFDRGFLLFNAIFVVNVVVVVMQLAVPNAFLANPGDSHASPIYVDHVSGLFGFQGTPTLGCYMLFLIVYNLTKYRNAKRRSYRRAALGAWAAIVVLVSVWVASANSTKAYFLLLPLMLLLFYVSSYAVTDNHWKKGGILVAALAAIVLAGGILYLLIPSARNFIDTRLISLLQLIFDSTSLGTDASGSNERVAMVAYALDSPATWLLGEGFGASHLNGAGAFGFQKFGQADFGSFVMLGGIWFYIALVALYTYMLSKICMPSGCKHKTAITLCIFLFLLLMTLYTRCFTKVNVMVCLTLLCMAFGLHWRNETASLNARSKLSTLKRLYA